MFLFIIVVSVTVILSLVVAIFFFPLLINPLPFPPPLVDVLRSLTSAYTSYDCANDSGRGVVALSLARLVSDQSADQCATNGCKDAVLLFIRARPGTVVPLVAIPSVAVTAFPSV